jgi:hypothetical protein
VKIISVEISLKRLTASFFNFFITTSGNSDSVKLPYNAALAKLPNSNVRG